MEIGDWLNNLNLGRYETTFRENSIDTDILPELTDRDLVELGVTLGDRKRLLKAIAWLSSDHRPSAAPAPFMPARAIVEAERRPITVMFCDLVGSTSLTAMLDAEDWRDLVEAYQDEASKAVTLHGGHVLKKLGDGLMALFGYPKAQENDAERAARAGLSILYALEELNARNVMRGLPALAARIGLETGRVVVDATGEVFGDAPNVAARVQSAAEPGTLYVTEGVKYQVAGLFVVEDKGPHELKGVNGKPTLYRLVRVSGGRRGGTRSLTPFVGREEELAILERRWERARAGDGQFVQIVGEPGLGKSRLIEELRGRLAAAPHAWIAWSSSQLLQNTPLHPIAEWGRQRFGGTEITPESRLAELEATLARVKLDVAEHAPLLAPLLDIPLPEARAPQVAPEELRRKQLAAVAAWLLAATEQQPIVLAFEDLHWADPTTLDLLKMLVERGAPASLLVVTTARPEFRAPWATRSHHSVISLSPLDRGEIIKMIAALAERHALSKEIIDGLTIRTGGLPLFIEEVTRLLLESGTQTIPPTLQQYLAARLDRLDDAREVAQIGAVLGREFSHVLLQSVAQKSSAALESALEKLVDADLMFVQGVAPSCSYRFKHALIQDAAYDSLLKPHRQGLHRRAADTLVALPDPQPELVAHHFTQSGETEEAIEWWGRAGDAALRRSAFPEAIANLGKAIELADRIHSTQKPSGHQSEAEKREKRARLQVGYAAAVMWAQGPTTPRAEIALTQIQHGSAGTIGSADQLSTFYAEGQRLFVSGRFREAYESGIAFLARSEAVQDPSAVLLACRRLGMVTLRRGKLAEAENWFERARRIISELDGNEATVAGFADDEAMAAAFLAPVMWLRGNLDAARGLIDGAIRRATTRNDMPAVVNARHVLTNIECLRGDAVAALSAAEALLSAAEQNGMHHFINLAQVQAAWARSRLPEFKSASATMQGVVDAHTNSGARDLAPFFKGLLADIVRADDANSALAAIDEGLRIAEETEGRFTDAYLLRLRGDVLSALGPQMLSTAEDAYRGAIEVAEEQGARTLVLLAACPLARLLSDANRPLEAYDVLASALEGFTPTSELSAIEEAKTLLAKLEETEPVRREQRNRGIRAKYAQAMMITEDYTSGSTVAAYGRIGVEREHLGRPAERWPVLYGQWLQSGMSGETEAALSTAYVQLQEGEQAHSPAMAASALRQISGSLTGLGRFAEAQRYAERARDNYNPSWAAEARAVTGLDFLALAECFLAIASWPTGDIDASFKHTDAAIKRAEVIDPAYTLVAVLGQALQVPAYARRPNQTLKLADRALAVAAEKGIRAHVASIRFFRSWAYGRLHDPVTGVSDLGVALDEAHERGVGIHDISALALRADLQVSFGAVDEALATIEEGLRASVDTGKQREFANLLTLRGDLLSRMDPAAAEASYRNAIAFARERGGRTYELLAAIPLARLLGAAHRPEEAREVLTAGIAGFAATPELPAIAEAQALLDSMIGARLVN